MIREKDRVFVLETKNTSYIFYADVFFVQNFIIKAVVLYLSLYVNKKVFYINHFTGLIRIVFLGVLATVFEILCLFYGESYLLFSFLSAIFEMPILLWIILRKERSGIIRCILAGYFFTLVINGVLEILWNCLGDTGGYVFYLLVACGLVYVFVRMYSNYKRMHKGILAVELRNGDRCMVVQALYDSGNCLKDPYTGKGVHIISEELFQALHIDEQKGVEIPYQALGIANGTIERFEVEYIEIQTQINIIEKSHILVGVADNTLFQDKKYQVILNEEIM